MVESNKLCSHHIFCAGDRTIPYARLCAMCIEKYCPEHLRADLRIYIHLDGLSVDANETAKWLTQVPCTEATIGLFGIRSDEKVSGKWHQAMINKIAEQFDHEAVLAFVDADCFLIDSSWHEATLKHDPTRHYSLVSGFKGDPIAEHRSRSIRKMRTTLFTLTPALHNKICDQKYNKDRTAHEKLAAQFPEVHFHAIKQMDCMVTSSLKAQLLGYEVEPLGDAVSFSHIGGFSYMPIKRNLQKYIGRENYLVRWLLRMRLNIRVLAFFERLGWKAWIDPNYAASIDDMMQLAQSDAYLCERLNTLPESKNEIKFQQFIELLEPEFSLIK